MRYQSMVVFASLIAYTSATLETAANGFNSRQGAPTRTLSPCAQVSVLLSDRNSSKPVPSTVPADIAYECLRSMPLNVTSAKKVLFQLPLYLNWQSTLDVLKKPPAEYVEKVQAPVDILAGLDVISSEIDSGDITSEWDFGWSLYQLLGSAHDGHLNYILDVVGAVFQFHRPLPLVSVSEDGKKLPAVFAYDDVLGTHFGNITYTPSPIVKIDNTDVNMYLEDLSQEGTLQDRDALYNNLFFSLAQVSLGSVGSATGMFTGGGRARFVPLGANTTLQFANGSVSIIQNFARTYIDFSNVSSGEDLRKKIVYIESSPSASRRPNRIDPVSNVSGEDDIPDTAAATPAGYPVPITTGPSNVINGYYLDDPGYEDVAILAVSSFLTNYGAETAFQAAGKKFLEKAWGDGKKKLIIDVQANGGGTILLGYDLYRQIFPDSDPYGGSRFRYNVAYDLVGQAFSEYASRYPRDAGLTNRTLRIIQSSYFDYHTDTTMEGGSFESWKQKAGPYDVDGNGYSAISRWNLTDIYVTYQGGINVTGRSNHTRWKPEDVVLLTDGYCASTCSIFAELLTQEGGVKTIALGGRSNTNKIQAVGGVRGANNYQWELVQTFTQEAIDLNVTLQNSALEEYDDDHALDRAWVLGLNVRDALRRDDSSGIALQFKYEDADCRLYYTPEMTVSATAIWKAAAKAQWNDPSTCMGNGDYYTPPYDQRTTQITTTSLESPRNHMSGALALEQFRALKNKFNLETEQQHFIDGFMQP